MRRKIRNRTRDNVIEVLDFTPTETSLKEQAEGFIKFAQQSIEYMSKPRLYQLPVYLIPGYIKEQKNISE